MEARHEVSDWEHPQWWDVCNNPVPVPARIPSAAPSFVSPFTSSSVSAIPSIERHRPETARRDESNSGEEEGHEMPVIRRRCSKLRQRFWFSAEWIIDVIQLTVTVIGNTASTTTTPTNIRILHYCATRGWRGWDDVGADAVSGKGCEGGWERCAIEIDTEGMNGRAQRICARGGGRGGLG